METEEYLGCNLERNIFEIKHDDCRNDRSEINISGIFFPPYVYLRYDRALSFATRVV